MNKISAALPCILAMSAHAASPLITVSGTCNRNLNPDRASVTLTVEEKNASPSVASRKVQDKYNELRKDVLKLKLPDADLRTSEYSVYEIREWENNKSISKGYQARMGLKITSSGLDKISEVLSLTGRSEVRDAGALTFFLSEKATAAAKSDCLEEATLAAKAKAERIAKALGRSLSNLVSIEEEGTSSPITPLLAQNRGQSKAPMAAAQNFAADAGGGGTVVDQGTLTLQLSLTSTYEVK